jgi:HPt (histidine-containing phosphotransfer) domain-containing protein
MLDRVITLYLRSSPRHVARMTDALGRGYASGLRDAAHALKGAAAYVAAPAVVKAAERLETAARGRHLGRARAAFDEVRRAVAALEVALRGFRASSAATGGRQPRRTRRLGARTRRPI